MTDKALEVQPYTETLRTPGPLEFRDIRKNTQLVKKALQEVMVEKVDYGKIPGCGDKPGLFKPGAEKLMLMFKLGAFPETKNESDSNDVMKYVTRTKIVHLPTGIELCVGLGCASTDEEKYKWRRAVSEAEWEATPDERRRLKYLREGDPTKQVRTNPADIENTVLKMSKKRSVVDAVIMATAATDIFNQGEDDIIIDIEESRAAQPKKLQTKEPQKVHTQPELPTGPIPAGTRELIAKFDSTCKGCQADIKKGEKILYSDSKKASYHGADCVSA